MATIKTMVYRKKLAQAMANGGDLPKITKIAFGTGGATPDGSPKSYNGTESTMFHKIIEKDVSPVFVNDTLVSYKATISSSTEAALIGQNINESALIDEDGDIVAMKTFRNKGMEQGVTINFEYEIEF